MFYFSLLTRFARVQSVLWRSGGI